MSLMKRFDGKLQEFAPYLSQFVDTSEIDPDLFVQSFLFMFKRILYRLERTKHDKQSENSTYVDLELFLSMLPKALALMHSLLERKYKQIFDEFWPCLRECI